MLRPRALLCVQHIAMHVQPATCNEMIHNSFIRCSYSTVFTAGQQAHSTQYLATPTEDLANTNTYTHTFQCSHCSWPAVSTAWKQTQHHTQVLALTHTHTPVDFSAATAAGQLSSLLGSRPSITRSATPTGATFVQSPGRTVHLHQHKHRAKNV